MFKLSINLPLVSKKDFIKNSSKALMSLLLVSNQIQIQLTILVIVSKANSIFGGLILGRDFAAICWRLLKDHFSQPQNDFLLSSI